MTLVALVGDKIRIVSSYHSVAVGTVEIAKYMDEPLLVRTLDLFKWWEEQKFS